MGSPPHLAMELFEQITGTKMVHIAYKGAAPAVVDLISGNVQLGINALPSVLQHIKSGKLIPLAVITETRDKNLPDIPTMKEAGIEHFDYPVWYGLFAPAATPKELVEKINADLQRALNDPDVVKQLDGQGAYAAPSSQKAFTAAIAKDIAAWSKLINERNLQLEE
jgi:tripartite-type tricarboxylate transporter receptor subunit TctC